MAADCSARRSVVVVGIDGGQASVPALRRALDEARANNGLVEMVTAWTAHDVTDVPSVWAAAREARRRAVAYQRAVVAGSGRARDAKRDEADAERERGRGDGDGGGDVHPSAGGRCTLRAGDTRPATRRNGGGKWVLSRGGDGPRVTSSAGPQTGLPEPRGARAPGQRRADVAAARIADIAAR